MFAPGARHGQLSPHSLLPFVLITLGALVFLAGWLALLTGVTVTGSLSRDGSSVPSPLRSAAYLVPEAGEDVIYVRGTGDGDLPRAVASFPRVLSLGARGVGSPAGDRLAVLHIAGGPGQPAHLSFVTLPGGEVQDVEGQFDYLSGLAWSPSGARVAAVRTQADARPTGRKLEVIEVDTTEGTSRTVATFENADQAVPVGYSPDGLKLFVAVIDQSGSSLWEASSRGAERVAMLSDGPTRDWSLSPDASRLAFIDRMGVGERKYVARILALRTGRIDDAPLTGDQIGTAWRPDSRLVDFGGPGGSAWFGRPRENEGYVIPQLWSPDGSLLAATVYIPEPGTGQVSEHIEIMSEEFRLPLSLEPGARFLGFVRDQ